MFNYFRITYCVTAEYQKKKTLIISPWKMLPGILKHIFFVIFKKTFYFLVICKTFIHSYIKLNFYKCEKSTWVLMKCLLKNRFILKKSSLLHIFLRLSTYVVLEKVDNKKYIAKSIICFFLFSILRIGILFCIIALG